jgi:hypothetical protein
MTMPGFTGDASLYHSVGRYRLAATANVNPGAIALAQVRPQISCVNTPVDTSTCSTGCQRVCNIGGETTETCVSAGNCFPVSCGPCLLTIPQTVVSQLLSGQPIDTSQVLFTQTCHQGTSTFTQTCTICSAESRISLPFPISDRCIRVCSGGLDPSSYSISSRTC